MQRGLNAGTVPNAENLSNLAITTATSERKFSTLKRVKTYLRNTMGEERLTRLALISINGRSFDMDPDNIINEGPKAKEI